MCSSDLASAAPAADADVRVTKDVAFLAAGRAEKLDVYQPAPRADGRPHPALVWIHGGGWTGGTKNEARADNVCRTAAKAGYVAVSIDYRLGKDSWPTNLLDCKNAVRFLRAHAQEYQIDPARIGVMAISLGGYYAPRAAAFEPRFACCIAWGAQWDYHATWKGRFEKLDQNKLPSLSVPWEHLLWILNAGSRDEAMKKLEGFKLDGVRSEEHTSEL